MAFLKVLFFLQLSISINDFFSYDFIIYILFTDDSAFHYSFHLELKEILE